MRLTSLGALLFVVLTSASCSSNSPDSGGSGGTAGTAAGSSCNENPWACATGQTCVPTSLSTWACVASEKGAGIGATCTSLYNMATCDDGLLCVETSKTDPGTCAPFCDATNPAHTCAANLVCDTVTLDGITADGAQVCVPTPPGSSSNPGAAGSN